MILWIIVFILGLFTLSKAANYFNESAENIGLSLGISRLVIGIVLLAIGTSLPELISSIIAVQKDSSEMVFANVAGSNVANIFFVIGLSVLIYRKSVKMNFPFINIDLQFLIGSVLFILVTSMDMIFNKWEGMLSIIAYVIYMVYLISAGGTKIELEVNRYKFGGKVTKYYLIFPLSIIFLYLGGEWTVRSVIMLSEYLHIGKDIIASSAIALGTSLPELFVTLNAFKKEKPEMAIGNILGSCIFNSFMVMGIASLFGDLVISQAVIHLSLLFIIVATLLFFIITRDRNINKWEGALFLLFYVLYMIKLFELF